jgi:hypothetical protein
MTTANASGFKTVFNFYSDLYRDQYLNLHQYLVAPCNPAIAKQVWRSSNLNCQASGGLRKWPPSGSNAHSPFNTATRRQGV